MRESAPLITCHRSHFEARCRERGASVVAAMPCVVSEDGDWLQIDPSHAAYPRQGRGLGDYVSIFLDAIGVTKKRVEAVVGGPCGCPERQAWMNAAGEKWLGLSPGSTAPENKG